MADDEAPEMTMLGEALRPDMFERLRELESFREYEAKVEARAEAKADAAPVITRACSRHG